MTLSFTMSGTTADFNTRYSPSISLDANKKYEAALISLEFYNAIPNIDSHNNTFKYSTDKGQTFKIIKFDTGSYEFSSLNLELQRILADRGDYDSTHQVSYIDLAPNLSKLTSIVRITNENYLIDFDVENSIGGVLGFKSEKIGFGYNESPQIVDITKIISILVNVDIIVGSYVNGSNSATIYAFAPNVPPGYKIVERPSPSLIYYSISRHEIDSMRVWLTDQNNRPIDLRGETCVVRISIREVH